MRFASIEVSGILPMERILNCMLGKNQSETGRNFLLVFSEIIEQWKPNISTFVSHKFVRLLTSAKVMKHYGSQYLDLRFLNYTILLVVRRSIVV